jgi:flagellar biosynthetic protein FliQ
MTQALAIQLARDAIVLAIMTSAPLLLVAVSVGVLVSVVQTVTQIQEQTLSFVPKLFAVAVAFLMSLSWLIQQMTRYCVDLFSRMGGMVG